MNAHSNSFGDYQATLRVNGRAAIGVGHTPGEAWRNACDCFSDRFEILQGAMAVMRKIPRPENIECIKSRTVFCLGCAASSLPSESVHITQS